MHCKFAILPTRTHVLETCTSIRRQHVRHRLRALVRRIQPAQWELACSMAELEQCDVDQPWPVTISQVSLHTEVAAAVPLLDQMCSAWPRVGLKYSARNCQAQRRHMLDNDADACAPE